MPINEFVNLRGLFQKHNPEELKKLEMLARSVLFTRSLRMKRACIKSIRDKYKSISEIVSCDNQIMAEIYLFDGINWIIREEYLCEVPKEHIGEYREVQI